MRILILFFFVFCCYRSIEAACLYKTLGGCPSYDVSTGVITCPNCPCSCTGSSSFCSCGAPPCSCFLDTADVCKACKPEPSPICSCLAAMEPPCSCDSKTSFIYFPEVTYPVMAMEMNPFFFRVITCPNCPCSCTGSSSFCSCGAPPCSCFLDTADVCKACKPEPSPICSCLAAMDPPCSCDSNKAFIYFPEVTYPVMAMEMNPFYFSTCFNL